VSDHTRARAQRIAEEAAFVVASRHGTTVEAVLRSDAADPAVVDACHCDKGDGDGARGDGKLSETDAATRVQALVRRRRTLERGSDLHEVYTLLQSSIGFASDRRLR
jgi:hypothetical protein